MSHESPASGERAHFASEEFVEVTLPRTWTISQEKRNPCGKKRDVSGWELEGPTAVIISACPPDTWSSPPKHMRGTTHFHSVNAMRGRQLASVSEIWARAMLLLDKSWISWGTHGDFTSDNASRNEHSLDPWMRKLWDRVPNQSMMITGQQVDNFC